MSTFQEKVDRSRTLLKAFLTDLVNNPDEVCEEEPSKLSLHIKARNGSAFPDHCFMNPEVRIVIYGPYNEIVPVRYSSDNMNGIIITALEEPAGLVRISTTQGVVSKEFRMGLKDISCDGHGKIGQT